MKKWLINIIFEMPFYMAAGLGFIKIPQIVFSLGENVPLFLLIPGLLFGLLIWKLKIKMIKKFAETSSPKQLNLYIYLSTAIIYISAFFGIVELVRYFLGHPPIIYAELLDWEFIVVLVLYVVGWHSKVDRFKEEIGLQSNK